MRIRVTTVALITLNLGLAAWVALLWNRGQAQVREPATLVTPPLELPNLSVLNSTPMPGVDASTIRNQAVFHSSRSFYEPPPVPVEVTAPEYEMAGTLRLADGKRIAFVKRKADRSSRTLHVGDDLEGWRVQVIDADRIVLDHNEQTAELRAGTGTGVSGLIRGPGIPRTVVTGIRVLGASGSGAAQAGGQALSLGARTYRPPTPVGK
jgi:hypothetical protein